MFEAQMFARLISGLFVSLSACLPACEQLYVRVGDENTPFD